VIGDETLGHWEVEDVEVVLTGDEHAEVFAGGGRYQFISVHAERLAEIVDPPTDFAEQVIGIGLRGGANRRKPVLRVPKVELRGPFQGAVWVLAVAAVAIAIWFIANS
jgi:hypothetical protein